MNENEVKQNINFAKLPKWQFDELCAYYTEHIEPLSKIQARMETKKTIGDAFAFSFIATYILGLIIGLAIVLSMLMKL